MHIDDIDRRILAEAEALALRSGARFHTKPTPLMWVFHVLLLVITFGQMRDFMTRFTTTVDKDIYFPSEPKHPFSRAKTIFHELVHFWQQERDGRLKYTTLYLLWPPYRARCETEAYQMSNAVTIWRGVKLDFPSRKQVELFTGWSYFKMDTDQGRVRERLMQGITEIKAGSYEVRFELAATVKGIVKGAMRPGQ